MLLKNVLNLGMVVYASNLRQQDTKIGEIL